tara:strand:+ start:505 stop:681 length:177 start_codon:yes stop_codon:yes gene_type:complete
MASDPVHFNLPADRGDKTGRDRDSVQRSAFSVQPAHLPGSAGIKSVCSQTFSAMVVNL